MKALRIFFGLSFCLLVVSSCDRDASGTTDPKDASAQAAAPAGSARPARQTAKGQALQAELPPANSACPEGKGPGDKWKSDCNTCFCNENGKVACTLMACLSDDR